MGKRPDVIVVGGGVNGTSITYRLAEAGRSVLLLEQRGIASGASGRNGGMTGSGAPHPTPEGMAGHRIREANTELMRRLPDELGVDFDLRLEGSLDVATTEAMFDDLKHAVDALDAAGLKHDSRMLDTYEAAFQRGRWVAGVTEAEDQAAAEATLARLVALVGRAP